MWTYPVLGRGTSPLAVGISSGPWRDSPLRGNNLVRALKRSYTGHLHAQNTRTGSPGKGHHSPGQCDDSPRGEVGVLTTGENFLLTHASEHEVVDG